MLSLTGKPLLVLAVVAALLPIIGVAWLARRVDPGTPGRWRLARVLTAAALVVAAQGFAMGALALEVNDHYLFYTSWADLTGEVPQVAGIQTAGVLPAGEGTVRVMTAHARHTGTDHEVLVWLPPEYDLPAYRTHRFPVVMFLTGQPSTPATVFHEFQFAPTAMRLIHDHRAQPFIGVFPTLMVSPPRDTECTDVPGGPMAETWLSRDVGRFIADNFRVAAPGRAWTVMGWSTGGFCAAKLVLSDPAEFGSAVSFGGYYTPLQDSTTGSLFSGETRLARENSPEWLYTHNGGLRGSRLLLISGQQDRHSWGSTKRMLETVAGDPAVASVSFPVGGHNYRDYASYLAAALGWSARSWPASP
jgi:hypothetical protein